MPRKPSQADWNRMSARAGRVAAGYVAKLASGVFTPGQFAAKMLTYLAARHTAAVILGRRRGGLFGPPDDDDKAMGASAAEAQTHYLNTFADDIRAGRYMDQAGALRQDAVNARALLYVKRLLGTANDAFTMTAQSTDLIAWIQTPAEHCESCNEYAAGSPYLPDNLPAYPGDGRSECLVNCRCYLVRQKDGVQGFEAYGGDV